MKTPPIVSPQEWEAARQQLLVKEKGLTRARDALAAERRRMPWLAVEKEYEFEGPKGTASLPDLFEGRRQLIVYRAFFEPGVSGRPDHACPGCSLVADQVAHVAHLNARDTTLACRVISEGTATAVLMWVPELHDRRWPGRPMAWRSKVSSSKGRVRSRQIDAGEPEA